MRKIRNFLNSHVLAIDKDEAEAYYHQDLTCIKPTMRTPLRTILEKFEYFRSTKLIQRRMEYGSRNDEYNPVEHSKTIYHNSKRIEMSLTILICVAGFLMLAAPLWILLYVSSRQHQLIVITVFVAFFLAIVQSVTIARPFESLAATAA
jgi:hypothetical protein